MDGIVVFCADVGSVKSGNFGWARTEVTSAAPAEHNHASPSDLAAAVADELGEGRPVALGFECPLFLPVPENPLQLGMARHGEGSRPWSAGAGTGALATGLVQTAWVLAEIEPVRRRTASTTTGTSSRTAARGSLSGRRS